MRFLKFRSDHVGRTVGFTGEAGVFFILTVSLHEMQLQKFKNKQKKSKKYHHNFLSKLGQVTMERHSINSMSLFCGHTCTILSCNWTLTLASEGSIS